ncbi:DJ-1/PfpI family protein [Tahibacter harae]|uniref:DJ-1/PfpI family protein n=1 Tax=Tahibacter harae TaxID=2963937 RepID=A0ABT1QWA1_9GAMM|nr:DJ-1/PfpI family protein [Tahibacter harae]MCQ4166562.1 DJ-1/PfpI family protein [Tahibacter harae]
MSRFIRHCRGALRALLISTLLAGSAAAADKVLLVVSSEGRDQGKTRPGFEMDEFAQAYLIFRDNGWQIDVASPAGGAVQADKYDPKETFNARLLEDAQAQRLLQQTLATAQARAADYAAVYVIGGKGAMFDLAQDKALATLIAAVYQHGGVVAAVCHGPAALVDVRLADGSALVAGRRLTGFSNEEEALFGKRWSGSYRFQLEDALRERGARWSEAALMLPHVVADGRLLTGQNPYSTAALTEAVITVRGRKPAARESWRDEATMALVQRLLAGEDAAARSELAANLARYHVELIGMLGYYQLKAATDDAAVRNALAIMQLALPHMPQPQLTLGLAEAELRLGRKQRARELIDSVLASHPDMAEAKQLLARIDG